MCMWVLEITMKRPAGYIQILACCTTNETLANDVSEFFNVNHRSFCSYQLSEFNYISQGHAEIS